MSQKSLSYSKPGQKDVISAKSENGIIQVNLLFTSDSTIT